MDGPLPLVSVGLGELETMKLPLACTTPLDGAVNDRDREKVDPLSASGGRCPNWQSG